MAALENWWCGRQIFVIRIITFNFIPFPSSFSLLRSSSLRLTFFRLLFHWFFFISISISILYSSYFVYHAVCVGRSIALPPWMRVLAFFSLLFSILAYNLILFCLFYSAISWWVCIVHICMWFPLFSVNVWFNNNMWLFMLTFCLWHKWRKTRKAKKNRS